MKEHGRLPSRKENYTLRIFVEAIRYKHKKGVLDKSIIDKLSFTRIFGDIKQDKWEKHFNDLLLYRKQYPDKWPSERSKDINVRKIGSWCSNLKLSYKQNKLEDEWIDKLHAIGFNFKERNYFDNIWFNNFEDVKKHFENNESIKGLSKRLILWCCYQFRKFKDADSSLFKVEQLNSINFFKYKIIQYDWDDKYKKIKEFMELNNKLPTRVSNKGLFYWLVSQRATIRRGNLSENKLLLFEKLGVNLLSKREDFEVAWNRNYLNVILFREKNNGRWPYTKKQGAERKLYIWCYEQRRNKIKLGKGLIIENKEHTAKLNEIGFEWCKKKDEVERWNKMLCKLVDQYKISKKIPLMIEGKRNPLYNWNAKQLRDIKTNTIQVDRKARFLAVIQ